MQCEVIAHVANRLTVFDLEVADGKIAVVDDKGQLKKKKLFNSLSGDVAITLEIVRQLSIQALRMKYWDTYNYYAQMISLRSL